MLSNIFLCQHYFGEQGEQVSTNENNLYNDPATYLESVKKFCFEWTFQWHAGRLLSRWEPFRCGIIILMVFHPRFEQIHYYGIRWSYTGFFFHAELDKIRTVKWATLNSNLSVIRLIAYNRLNDCQKMLIWSQCETKLPDVGPLIT